MNQSSSISSESNCNSLFVKTVSLRYVSSDLADAFLLAAGVLNFLVCPFTCFLNALVILAVETKRRLQTHSNILLACLALTDLIIGVVVQPLHGTMTTFLLQGKGFNEFCGINLAFTVSFVVVSCASLSHLVLISGERYLTIKYSFTHNKVLTKPRIIVSSAIAWIAAIIIFIFLSKSMSIAIPVFVITSLCSVICLQVLVYKKAKRHEKQILAQQVNVEAKARFKKKKALKLTTLVILVIFLSVFIPSIFMSVTWQIFGEKFSDDVKTTVRHFSLGMVNLNSVINPIIYTVRIRPFRVAFIELLWRKRFQEAEEFERKLFRSRHNVVRPEFRQEGEMMEQNVEQRNRQIQPAAAACHEGTAGGFQIISITTAKVAVNSDIKVFFTNTRANNVSIERERRISTVSRRLGKR